MIESEGKYSCLELTVFQTIKFDRLQGRRRSKSRTQSYHTRKTCLTLMDIYAMFQWRVQQEPNELLQSSFNILIGKYFFKNRTGKRKRPVTSFPERSKQQPLETASDRIKHGRPN